MANKELRDAKLKGNRMAHTFEPWKAQKQQVVNKRGQIIADCSVFDDTKKPISDAERDANAEFIVTACNNYEKLLLVLKSNLDAMQGILPFIYEDPEGADAGLYWAIRDTEHLLANQEQAK